MGDDSGFTRWQISPNMSKKVSVPALGRSWLHEVRESGNGVSKMFFRLPLAVMRERERQWRCFQEVREREGIKDWWWILDGHVC